ELEIEGETKRCTVDPKAMMVSRGQETQIAPLDRQFNSKSVPKRALAIFGGPLMNFVLAFILFAMYVFMTGIPIKESGKLMIAEVISDSPAEAGGVQAGDEVISINGEPIGSDDQKLTKLINASADEPMTWQVERAGETVELTVTPRMTEGKAAMVGIYMSIRYDDYRKPTLVEAASGTWNQATYWTEQIFIGLKKLVTLQVKLQDLGGPVDIARTTGE